MHPEVLETDFETNFVNFAFWKSQTKSKKRNGIAKEIAITHRYHKWYRYRGITQNGITKEVEITHRHHKWYQFRGIAQNGITNEVEVTHRYHKWYRYRGITNVFGTTWFKSTAQ